MILDICLALIAIIIGVSAFFGKAHKKISHMIVSIISVVAAYFTKGFLAKLVMKIKIKDIYIGDALKEKLMAFFAGQQEQVGKLVYGLFSIAAFMVIAILLFIIGDIIAKIISKSYKKRTIRRKAWKTFGIPGLISGALRVGVILLPLFILSPMAENLSKLPVIGDNQIVQFVSDQYNSSYVIKLSDKFFDNDNHENTYDVAKDLLTFEEE